MTGVVGERLGSTSAQQPPGGFSSICRSEIRETAVYFEDDDPPLSNLKDNWNRDENYKISVRKVIEYYVYNFIFSFL